MIKGQNQNVEIRNLGRKWNYLWDNGACEHEEDDMQQTALVWKLFFFDFSVPCKRRRKKEKYTI
jgi:hypothetical protein